MKVNGQWVPCASNSSYSYIQILLILYRCFDHALKICMWFGYNPQINFFDTFFAISTYSLFQHLHNESEWTVGPLCKQLLLQLYSDSFETLQMS